MAGGCQGETRPWKPSRMRARGGCAVFPLAGAARTPRASIRLPRRPRLRAGPLIDALDALFNARIPKAWLAVSWEATTLGSWFAGLLARHDQIAKWLTTGRPRAYWMTGFFNPQVGEGPRPGGPPGRGREGIRTASPPQSRKEAAQVPFRALNAHVCACMYVCLCRLPVCRAS